jgi:ABC-type sugar transport system ATPase subunit
VAEVRDIFALCRRLAVPMTFRAAGTSLSGQAQSDGVLVEVGRHWRRVAVEADGARVRLQQNGTIGTSPTRRATLGIRPEDLRIAPNESLTADSATDTLSGRVVLVERLGGSNHVHFEVGPRRLMASIGNDVLPAVGDLITVRMLTERMHLFDADGRTLDSGAR